MKITQEGEELVLRLPLSQKSYDAVDEYTGDVPNLVGVIFGKDFSISQNIDLGYKGTEQTGSPYIMFDTREQLEEQCKKFNLDIREYPNCAYCQKPIMGSFTLGDLGNQCYECENLPQTCTNCGNKFKNELSDMCGSCFEMA